MNSKLGQHIDDFVSELLPIWFCSFCAISCYVFPENNVYPHHGIVPSLYFAILGLYVSLPPVLIIQLICKKARKIVWGLLFGFGLLNVAIDVVVIETTQSLFCLEHVALILGSNVSESTEFFKSYFSIDVIIKILVFEASCIFVWWITQKASRGKFSKLVSSAILILVLFASLFSNILKSESWNQVYLCKSRLFFAYSPAEDLRAWRQNPEIEIDSTHAAPRNIVVIIGESFSKSHSSLYGYDKLTNPLLASLPENRFFVFPNVESPDTHTVPAIKQELSMYDASASSSKEWYKYLTLFDIAKEMGYKTTWISNQSKSGLCDNVVTRFSELTDYQIWCGTESAGFAGLKKEYDDIVLPVFEDSYSKGNEDSFHMYFIHLMGSHASYSSRYPNDFSNFSSSDYPAALTHQKQILSEYDNSILYNDFIIHSIIKQIDDSDCVALYFSDHAQDIYQSSSDYCGHAIDSNPESVYWGEQVPMMFYVSDRYAARNPDFLSIVEESKLNEYNLNNLVYTLADIMGAVTINSESVADKSLFNEKAQD